MIKKGERTQEKINRYLRSIRTLKKTVAASPSASKAFLLTTGIYTKKGNLRKAYK